jgi:hypothetical protein
MSFEGYYQYWCSNGHHWVADVYMEQKTCPHCKALAQVENLVDETNCESYGYIKPKVAKEPPKCPTCHQCVGPAIYKIPKIKKK